MKKLLLTLAISLSVIGTSYASESKPIIYYDAFDLDLKCGLKATNTITSKDETSTPKKESKNLTKAKIVSVIDGDTVTVKVGSTTTTLRMIGVDTPETVHPSKPVGFFGKEASDFTKKNLTGKVVYLEKDVSETDRYGRSLRYIWLSLPKDSANPTYEEIRDKMFNGILLRDGYGSLATFPPDVKYLDQFRKIAKTAEEKDLGLYNESARAKFEASIPSSKGEKIVPTTKKSEKPTTSKVKAKKTGRLGKGDLPIVNQKTARISSKKGTYLADVTRGPIKANMSSGRYHRPGQQGYNKISVNNVTWFSSAKAAEKAGYKPAKR